MSLKPNDEPKPADRKDKDKDKDKAKENKKFGLQKAKSPLIAERAFLNVVGERGLRASAMLALWAVAKATWSRYARLKPPSEVLILINYGRKKTDFRRFL